MKAGILVLGLAVLDLSWEVVFYSFSMAAPGGVGGLADPGCILGHIVLWAAAAAGSNLGTGMYV